MSNTSRYVAPQLDDLDPCLFDADDAFHTCGDCGSSLTLVRPGKYQCDYCEAAMLAPQSTGCAFGGGRSDELPEIPLAQAVQTCHDISAKINSWCECEAQGARKCGGCE